MTGDVTTNGKKSSAVVAQSLGGGGGNGATNITGTLNVAKEVAEVSVWVLEVSEPLEATLVK